jgi:hypothetical protein
MAVPVYEQPSMWRRVQFAVLLQIAQQGSADLPTLAACAQEQGNRTSALPWKTFSTRERSRRHLGGRTWCTSGTRGRCG